MTSVWWTNEVDRLDVKVKSLTAALQEIVDFERRTFPHPYTALDAAQMIHIAKSALEDS